MFVSMENFHAEFTAVTSQRTGGGTAFMYASTARQLFEASSNASKQTVLREFVEKLRERVPSLDEFKASFAEILFAEGNTRQRQLVRYLLRRVDSHLRLRSGSLPDYETYNIEHIAPQKAGVGARGNREVVGMLGNLILVPEDLNTRLDAKPFEEKKRILNGSDVPVDMELVRSSQWGAREIRSRTDWLAKLCYEKIFKV